MRIKEHREAALLRQLIREALTATDKREIDRMAKKQAKRYFDQSITRAIDDELGKSYFGTRGKINKFVEAEISRRFKDAARDKDFDASVVKVSKRVLRALYDMHYKRSNLIDNMPVPKS